MNRQRARLSYPLATAAASIASLAGGVRLLFYEALADGKIDSSDTSTVATGCLSVALGAVLAKITAKRLPPALRERTTYDLVDLSQDGMVIGGGLDSTRSRKEIIRKICSDCGERADTATHTDKKTGMTVTISTGVMGLHWHGSADETDS